MFDVVEHDARQRHLHLGRFLAIEHQAGLVAARAVVEHGAQDFAFGRREKLSDRSAEDLLERHLHQVGETLVAVHDVAGDRERGRAFLHALDQRAIGRVGAAQREHAPLAVLVGQQQRVDLAAVDGVQIAFRLDEAGAEFFDIELVDVHASNRFMKAQPGHETRAIRHVADHAALGRGAFLDERGRGEDLLVADQPGLLIHVDDLQVVTPSEELFADCADRS